MGQKTIQAEIDCERDEVKYKIDENKLKISKQVKLLIYLTFILVIVGAIWMNLKRDHDIENVEEIFKEFIVRRFLGILRWNNF